MAAVPVVGGRAERQIDVAELLVGRHVGPHVGAAGVGPRVVSPGVVAELALLRNRMQRPQLLAGADVEAVDVATRPFLVGRAVVNARADHHDVADDDRRRADGKIRRAHRVRDAGVQVDFSAIAERRVERAGLRINGNQIRVVGAEQQALGACRRSRTRCRDARTRGCPDAPSSSSPGSNTQSDSPVAGLIAAICPSEVTVYSTPFTISGVSL